AAMIALHEPQPLVLVEPEPLLRVGPDIRVVAGEQPARRVVDQLVLQLLVGERRIDIGRGAEARCGRRLALLRLDLVEAAFLELPAAAARTRIGASDGAI